jgi:hypothetical protein
MIDACGGPGQFNLPTFSRLAYPGPLPIEVRHGVAPSIVVKAPDIVCSQASSRFRVTKELIIIELPWSRRSSLSIVMMWTFS